MQRSSPKFVLPLITMDSCEKLVSRSLNGQNRRTRVSAARYKTRTTTCVMPQLFYPKLLFCSLRMRNSIQICVLLQMNFNYY